SLRLRSRSRPGSSSTSRICGFVRIAISCVGFLGSFVHGLLDARQRLELLAQLPELRVRGVEFALQGGALRRALLLRAETARLGGPLVADAVDAFEPVDDGGELQAHQ